jgi:hypothetical protein
VGKILNFLITSGKVTRAKVAQPGKTGVRPERVWSGRADPSWEW